MEDVTTMLNETPMQVNFANIDTNYLKKVRARKERDSQENFKCNRWGYRCAREVLWRWIFAHMLLPASRPQWKMELLEGILCLEVPVGKKNIINGIFMGFQSSDDVQQSIKNCKTSKKLTVNMLQILSFKENFLKMSILFSGKEVMKNITTFLRTEKEKNHLHGKAESKSNKGCTMLRDRNPCTFCKNAKIIDNSDKWAFIFKARKKINSDLGFGMGLFDLCTRAMTITQNRRPLALSDRSWSQVRFVTKGRAQKIKSKCNTISLQNGGFNMLRSSTSRMAIHEYITMNSN